MSKGLSYVSDYIPKRSYKLTSLSQDGAYLTSIVCIDSTSAPKLVYNTNTAWPLKSRYTTLNPTLQFLPWRTPNHLSVVQPPNYIMSPTDFQQSRSETVDNQPAIDCDACQSVLDPDGQQSVSFLLLDHLRIPLLSCDDHLEQFTSICELTSNDTATLLHHQPAGGISCPGCRFASYSMAQSLVPVQDGAIVPVACPEHQSKIIQRFQTGLQTHQQLTSGLGTTTDSLL